MSKIKNSPYEDSLRYVKYYWKKITFSHTRDEGIHLGLPNKFVAPNNEIYRKDQFYWDTYFVILGLVKDKTKIKLAKGMVENFLFLFKRFNIMPMRNRYYNIGISQIPFLTSMAFEIYEVDQDRRWLHKVIKVAEKELKKYWMNEKLTEKHIMYRGLSRYCDHYITHLGAEHESGWDMTSRFHDRCLDYLPVDLNTCLYKYETDIARAYTILKNKRKAKEYSLQAEKRREVMQELMWNEKLKFFFDYNKNRKQQNHFYSVAGFYPLWAKLATQEQAEQIRLHVLPTLEYEGGVSNTQSSGLSPDLKQHDHPNGWPHQQYIVVKGLLNYGYVEDAERIARKWVDMNVKLFHETGKFWEKYNVVTREIGVFNPDRYPTQSGFGWTNAIFFRLIKELKLEEKKVEAPVDTTLKEEVKLKVPAKKKAVKKRSSVPA
jgi:alpha,alpha-trehalase